MRWVGCEYLSPQLAMLFKIGSKSLPFGVSVYSTRGGTSAKAFLVIRPQSCISSSLWDNVRGLMPGKACSRAENRAQPSDSSLTIKAVHLLPKIAKAAATQPRRDSISGWFITFVCIVTLLNIVLVMLILYKL
jgi:hypothetical protein